MAGGLGALEVDRFLGPFSRVCPRDQAG